MTTFPCTVLPCRWPEREGSAAPFRGAAVAIILSVCGGLAFGQSGAATPSGPSAAVVRSTESGPPWSSLSPAQQADLAPLQKDWQTLDASRKEKWLVLARRFPGMSPTERERIQTRMKEWVRMSPAERGRARQNFQEMQIGRAEDRNALWDAYKALPAEQRQQLAQQARPANAPRTLARPASGPADVKPLTGQKRNIVQTQVQATSPKPISPTVVQAKPGATTTLLTTPTAPPSHTQPGLPKIVATEGFVNPSTLLPRRGPQGAAARSPATPASATGAQ